MKMPKQLSLIALLAIGSQTCPLVTSSAFGARGEPETLVEELVRLGAMEQDNDVIKLSDLYRSLPLERRKALVNGLLLKAVRSVDSTTAKGILEASLGIKVHESLLAEFKAREVGQLTGLIVGHLDNDPTWLDSFPTIPLDLVPLAQEALFRRGHADETRLAAWSRYPKAKPAMSRPFDMPPSRASWNVIELKETGDDCAHPTWKQTPAHAELGLYTGMQPAVKEDMVPCHLENSTQVAELFNQLTNRIVGETRTVASSTVPSMPIAAQVTIQGTNGPVSARVKNYSDFLRLLGEAGLEVELFNLRVHVDFFGYHFKASPDVAPEDSKSVRIVTWIGMRTKDGYRRLPAEHSELDVVIYRRDKVTGKSVRWAQLQWFFGIPDPRFNGTATFWRPYEVLRASWSRPYSEYNRVLSSAELSSIDDSDRQAPATKQGEALAFFDAAALTMRGFKNVHSVYNPPLNSYGLFICSDSAAAALGVMDQVLGVEREPGQRATYAFPILRSSARLTDKIFGVAAGADMKELKSRYPADYALMSQSPEQFEERLRRAFPEDGTLDWRMDVFTEAEMAQMRRKLTD